MEYKYSNCRHVDRLHNLPANGTWQAARWDSHEQLSQALILFWRPAFGIAWNFLKRGKLRHAWQYGWFYLFNGID